MTDLRSFRPGKPAVDFQPPPRPGLSPAEVWRSIRRGRPATTLAGVELVLVLVFVAFRVLNVSQTLAALSMDLRESTKPPLDLLAFAVLVLSGAALAVHLLRRGAYDEPRWGLLDAVTGVVLLLSTAVFTRPADRFTSWADWGYPVTLSVAFGAGIVFRRWWQVAVVVAALVSAYLITAAPLLADTADRSTATTNSLTYPVTAAVAWLLSGYLRRLGSDADAARDAAAELGTRLGAEVERQRHANLLHDHVTILDMFARGADADAAMLELARGRAAVSSAQIRSFLQGNTTPHGGLAHGLAQIAADYPTLHITLNVGLADRDVPPPVADAVHGAVRTALDNVLWHAGTTEVVLHAATTDGRWEVTVSDNGVGFDPASTGFGYGLSKQVVAAVSEVGGTVEITSEPGAGTVLVLQGPTATPPPQEPPATGAGR